MDRAIHDHVTILRKNVAYRWFAYDVIKNMIKKIINYDQFAPNFDMAYKTSQCVSVPNLKLFALMSYRPKKLENFLLCYTVDPHLLRNSYKKLLRSTFK